MRPSITTIHALRKRCESAGHPEHAIERDIHRAFSNGEAFVSTPITSSTDAAIAFVERTIPGCCYFIGKGRMRITEPLYGCVICASPDFASSEIGAGEHAVNLAFAIIIAALNALERQDDAA